MGTVNQFVCLSKACIFYCLLAFGCVIFGVSQYQSTQLFILHVLCLESFSKYASIGCFVCFLKPPVCTICELICFVSRLSQSVFTFFFSL